MAAAVASRFSYDSTPQTHVVTETIVPVAFCESANQLFEPVNLDHYNQTDWMNLRIFMGKPFALVQARRDQREGSIYCDDNKIKMLIVKKTLFGIRLFDVEEKPIRVVRDGKPSSYSLLDAIVRGVSEVIISPPREIFGCSIPFMVEERCPLGQRTVYIAETSDPTLVTPVPLQTFQETIECAVSLFKYIREDFHKRTVSLGKPHLKVHIAAIFYAPALRKILIFPGYNAEPQDLKAMRLASAYMRTKGNEMISYDDLTVHVEGGVTDTVVRKWKRQSSPIFVMRYNDPSGGVDRHTYTVPVCRLEHAFFIEGKNKKAFRAVLVSPKDVERADMRGVFSPEAEQVIKSLKASNIPSSIVLIVVRYFEASPLVFEDDSPNKLERQPTPLPLV